MTSLRDRKVTIRLTKILAENLADDVAQAAVELLPTPANVGPACVGRAVFVAFSEVGGEGEDWAGWYFGRVHLWYRRQLGCKATPSGKKNCELTFEDEGYRRKHFFHLLLENYGKNTVGGWYFVQPAQCVS